MNVPTVALEPPPAWVRAEVDRVPLAEGSGATITQWDAWRSDDGASTLLAGCVQTPIPGWVEDLRPSVVSRARGVALAASERLAGRTVLPEGDGASVQLLDATSRATIGSLASFLTFPRGPSAPAVATCFATCVDRHERLGDRACAGAVASAVIVDGGPPPAPGLTLGAASWATHHGRVVVLGALLMVLTGGFLGIVTRSKPRARI